jgi:ActR/RegA family two-component response regulator
MADRASIERLGYDVALVETPEHAADELRVTLADGAVLAVRVDDPEALEHVEAMLADDDAREATIRMLRGEGP